MRFIIYGAGAIGGVIGARLHAHGHEVILIARGAHLTAIRERGLTLIAPDERTTLPLPAVGHPREIAFRDDDVVLLAMKTQDTPAALDALSGCAEDVPVVCAQNGVANERMAARRFRARASCSRARVARPTSPSIASWASRSCRSSPSRRRASPSTTRWC